MGSEGGFAAKQKRDEFQARKVFADYRKAHRNRSGQDQADGSPQPGPKCNHDKQGHGRKPGGPAIKQRFNNQIDDQFQANHQTDDQQRRGPTVEHGQTEEHGRARAQDRSQIRHKAADCA